MDIEYDPDPPVPQGTAPETAGDLYQRSQKHEQIDFPRAERQHWLRTFAGHALQALYDAADLSPEEAAAQARDYAEALCNELAIGTGHTLDADG